jgi:hypothetical protein
MVIRCLIGGLTSNGSYLTIFCANSGHPSNMLPLLEEHYSSQDKIDALFKLGDRVKLTSSPYDKNDFATLNNSLVTIRQTNTIEATYELAAEVSRGDKVYFYFWDGETWEFADWYR